MRISIERQRHVLDFTLASLARRRGKNLALLVVYTLTVFLLASVLFFTHALRREAAAVLRDAPELTVQRLAAGRHEMIAERHVAALAAVKGVSGARGRLWGYYYDPVVRANYTFVAPDRFHGRDGEVVLGSGVARARGMGAGATFHHRAYDGAFLPFTVREIIPSDSELVSSDLVLVSEEAFRRLFGTPPGHFTDIALTVPNRSEIATVAAKVAHLLPDTRPITRAEIVRTYDSIFDWRSGLVVVVVSAAVLAFVVVAWDKASGLSAEERREIGVLKAIGWETSDVLLMKFWEGVALSLSAFLVGVLLAYAHVFLTPAVIFRPVLKGWSVLYPDFRLVPFVSGYQLATLFVLTVVPYTVATIVPSWRAAIVDPDSVMRG